ncbi:3'-phosphoadenosine 5'-phosphosulfate sulfotransferase (PAPS reductase)/FAD synthetase [Bradyrhizobium sp. LM3.2]
MPKAGRRSQRSAAEQADFHRLAAEVRNAKARTMSDAFSSKTALVLFSGGQDSTTCLAWALNRFARVETLGFDYRQRHAIELACRDQLFDGIRGLRADWAAKLGERATRCRSRRWRTCPRRH